MLNSAQTHFNVVFYLHCMSCL